jgi:HAD superfamily hydrolase (TIGR01509 family)
VPPVRALLWDLDGVIVDSGRYHYLAYREVLAPLGAEPAEEEFFSRLFGRRNEDIIRAVLGPGLPPGRVHEIAAAKEEAFRRLVRGNVRALPGAAELMRRAAEAGLKQAIVSSTPRANIDLILESLGLAGLPGAVVSAEDVTRGKPDPEGVLIAASRLQVEPSACLVIEDAPEGVEAARAAGMRALAVTTTRPAQRFPHAEAVVSSLEEPAVYRLIFGPGEHSAAAPQPPARP